MATQRNSLERRICFTANNYGDGAIAALKKIGYLRYACVGKEVGDSGTPHLQGMCTFTKQVRFNTIRKDFKKALGFLPHIERMLGTPEQAATYCKKDGDYEEWGDVPNPGKRNDLKEAVAELQSGKSISDLINDPNHGTVVVKYHKGLTFLSNELNKLKLARKKAVVWIHGPTGIGKTRKAMELAETAPGGWWISGSDLKWFDGYAHQQVVIFDDLRYNHASFSFLLRLLDRYELQVPIKGGFSRWNPGVIFITSPQSPREMFTTEWRNSESEDLRQLERRCTAILELPTDQHSLIWPMLKNHIEQDPTLVSAENVPTPTIIVPVTPPENSVDLTQVQPQAIVPPVPVQVAQEVLEISDEEPCMELPPLEDSACITPSLLSDSLDLSMDDFSVDLNEDDWATHFLRNKKASEWCYHCRSQPCCCYSHINL